MTLWTEVKIDEQVESDDVPKNINEWTSVNDTPENINKHISNIYSNPTFGETVSNSFRAGSSFIFRNLDFLSRAEWRRRNPDATEDDVYINEQNWNSKSTEGNIINSIGRYLDSSVLHQLLLKALTPTTRGKRLFDEKPVEQVVAEAGADALAGGEQPGEWTKLLGKVSPDVDKITINAALQNERASGAAKLVGSFASELLDPTTLIPLAASAKVASLFGWHGMTKYPAAALTGGTVGAADMAAYIKHNFGDITDNMDAMAFATTVGAVLSPLLVFGGDFIKGTIASKISTGRPITPEDLKESILIDRYLWDYNTVPHQRKMAEINGEWNFPTLPTSSGVTPRLLTGPNPRLNPPAPEGPITPEDLQIVMNPERAGKVTLEEYAALMGPEKSAAIDALTQSVVNVREQLFSLLKAENYVEAANLLNKTLNDIKLQKPNSVDVARTQDELYKYDRWVKEKNTEVPLHQRIHQKVLPPPKDLNVNSSPEDLFGGGVGTTFYSNPFFHLGLVKGIRTELTTGLVSGVFNASQNNWDGDAFAEGLLWGVGAGFAGKKVANWAGWKEFGKGGNLDLVLGWAAIKPNFVLKQYGKTGEDLVNAMEDTLRTAEQELSRLAKLGLSSLDKLKLSGAARKELYTEAAKLLRGTIKPSEVSREAIKLAKNLDKVFSIVARQARDAGVITQEAYQKMIKDKTKRGGYLPRYYDHLYLNSPKGTEAFIATLTSRDMSEEQALRVVRSLAGDTARESKELLKEVKRNSMRGRYQPTYSFANRLLKARYRKESDVRSGHLQKKRTLLPEDDALLEPFLINDVEKVLHIYLDETQKAIAFAKKFGAKDEGFVTINNQLGREFGANAQRIANEVFYQHVGSTNSAIVRQAQQFGNDGLQSFMGRVNAFQTLKLIVAQIPNMTQATAGGLSIMGRLSGNPYTPLKIWTQTVRQLAKDPKAAAEFGYRTGAAIESTLMQAAGEVSGIQHKIFGREATGIFSPLEYINDPSKYLKIIGFLGTEKLNRYFAANMGKEYFNMTVDKLIKLDNLQKTGKKLTPRQSRQLKRLEDTLKELNISPEQAIEGALDPQQFLNLQLKAGHAFSNIVNFRNTPGNVPIAWNHPFLTLPKKFKNFVYNHTGFLINNLFKPLATGNISGGASAIALYLGVAAPVLGMPVATLRDLFKEWRDGEQPEKDAVETYLSWWFSLGGLGIISSMAHSRGEPLGRAGQFLAGPSFGTGNALLSATGHVSPVDIFKFEGKDVSLDKAIRELWNEVPLIPSIKTDDATKVLKSLRWTKGGATDPKKKNKNPRSKYGTNYGSRNYGGTKY